MFWLIITGILFSVLLWKFFQMDTDFVLWYCERYGRKIDDEYRGKVIWITGASSGIGEYYAYEMAKCQARLVLSGTREKELERVAKKCISLAGYDSKNVLILPFNITDTERHEEMLEQVLKHHKKLDVLINNAGKSQRAKFIDIELEVDRQLFDINVFGLINLTRIVLRYFLEHNPYGQFGVTSSTAGILGVPFSASYTASKHALHGYFECLRCELSSARNIGITLFCVGPTFSNVLQNAFTGQAGKTAEGIHSVISRRMSTDRCAYLMAVSMANRLEQAWITIQPVLTLHYLSQYLPWTFKKFFPVIYTENIARRLREGE